MISSEDMKLLGKLKVEAAEARERAMRRILANEKTCSRCGETKELDDFHRASQNYDGRHSWCKACRSEYQADRVRRTGKC